MIIKTAPDYEIPPVDRKIFLAGGISNCPDWQSEFINMFKNDMSNSVMFNPRRPTFDTSDPTQSKIQIEWEYNRLHLSDTLVFWFSLGSINPIVLYELGMWANSRPDKRLVLGHDPEYERKEDVAIQTKLARPNVPIFTNLNNMAAHLKDLL